MAPPTDPPIDATMLVPTEVESSTAIEVVTIVDVRLATFSLLYVGLSGTKPFSASTRMPLQSDISRLLSSGWNARPIG